MTNDKRSSNHQLPAGESIDPDEEAFWPEGDAPEPVELREDANTTPRVFDLEERTARFGEAIIRFAKTIPQNPVNKRLIEQLVGAGTSVGANYCEADDGVSRKDFKNKIGTCRKEARETKFFLRMVATAEPNLKPQGRILWQEAKELHLIFSSIWRK
ncbi:MAG: four helix bundle protein [Verrucomicrobia bacterium]|nr:MAG: four helix bundle protein [Verrucomicrobiota bacterium]